MTKEEQLKILSAYLPYKITITDLVNNPSFILDEDNLGDVISDAEYLQTIRPHLRDLSDLTKEIEHNGEKFIPLDELTNGKTVQFNFTDFAEDWNEKSYYPFDRYVDEWICGEIHHFEFLPYGFIQKLLEWHFNVFNLEESEYINKATLKNKL